MGGIKIVTEIVTKQDNHVIITAPVLVPGEKDCDFERGEDPLTVEQVEQIAHAHLDYRVAEKNHEYLQTGEAIGTTVESFLLRQPMTLKSFDGEVKEYPTGTWIVSTKITDKESINKAEKGEYTGYSVTVLNKDHADKIISTKESSGNLIKDIKNPVGFAVSLVKKPCVSSAKICSIKKEEVENMPEEFNEDNFIAKIQKKFGLKEKLEPEFTTKEDVESIVKEAVSDLSADIVSALKEEFKPEEEQVEEPTEEVETPEVEEETTEEEDEEIEGASKADEIHNSTEPVVVKSDKNIIMEAMGRDPSTGLKKIN